MARRRALQRPVQLGDKDAHELWSSAANECRPFKDPAYDLRRAVRDSGAQAASPKRDAAVQVRRAVQAPCRCRCRPVPRPEASRAVLLHGSTLVPMGCCLQTSGGRPRPGAVQYEPRDMSAEQRREHLASASFQAFLRSTEPRWASGAACC